MDRDAFFAAAPAPRVEAVDCPELGGTVHVRTLTVGDLLDLAPVLNGGDGSRMLVPVVMRAACTADGAPLFAPGDEARLGALAGPALGALQRLTTAAIRLARLDDQSQAELGNA